MYLLQSWERKICHRIPRFHCVMTRRETETKQTEIVFFLCIFTGQPRKRVQGRVSTKGPRSLNYKLYSWLCRFVVFMWRTFIWQECKTTIWQRNRICKGLHSILWAVQVRHIEDKVLNDLTPMQARLLIDLTWPDLFWLQRERETEVEKRSCILFFQTPRDGCVASGRDRCWRSGSHHCGHGLHVSMDQIWHFCDQTDRCSEKEVGWLQEQRHSVSRRVWAAMQKISPKNPPDLWGVLRSSDYACLVSFTRELASWPIRSKVLELVNCCHLSSVSPEQKFLQRHVEFFTAKWGTCCWQDTHHCLSRWSRARNSSGNVYVCFQDESFTYEEIDRKSNKVANLMFSLGLKKGEAVALLMYNRPDFVWILLGESGLRGDCWRNGACRVTLSIGIPRTGSAIVTVWKKRKWSSLEVWTFSKSRKRSRKNEHEPRALGCAVQHTYKLTHTHTHTVCERESVWERVWVTDWLSVCVCVCVYFLFFLSFLQKTRPARHIFTEMVTPHTKSCRKCVEMRLEADKNLWSYL